MKVWMASAVSTGVENKDDQEIIDDMYGNLRCTNKPMQNRARQDENKTDTEQDSNKTLPSIAIMIFTYIHAIKADRVRNGFTRMTQGREIYSGVSVYHASHFWSCRL